MRCWSKQAALSARVTPPAIQHVGSLTLLPGGFLTIELDGSTAGNGAHFHDQIASSGAVTLNGGTLTGATRFVGSTGYVPTIGAFHAIITGTALTGRFTAHTFASADNPAGITFLPDYTATTLSLVAIPSHFGTAVPGLSANQIQIGTALESNRSEFIDHRTALDATGTLFNGLLILMSEQGVTGLRTAYDQLTPEKLTALTATSFQSASILNSCLQQRSAELRRFGPASVSLNGVARPAPVDESTLATVIEDGVHYQIATANPKKRRDYFARATGAFAPVDGSADRLGSFPQTGAASFGFDYALNDHQSFGVVVGQSVAVTDFSANSGCAQNTTSRVGVFHDFHKAGFFLNSSVTARFSPYDTKRKMAFCSALLRNGWTVRLSYDAILNPQAAEHRVNLSLNAGFSYLAAQGVS